MRISLLCPNVSNNALGRTYVLARVLERRYEVEVVGPAFSPGIWKPLVDGDFGLGGVKRVHLAYGPTCLQGLRDLRRLVTGDVIYACKPLLTSYGLGLSFKFAGGGRPIVLDIDDWEGGFARQRLDGLRWPRKARHFVGSALRLHTPDSYWNSFLFERLGFCADATTVSNGFLRRRFGGTLLWHGRDTDRMCPDRFDGRRFREETGIDPKARVVMFLGTFHPYKGVEDLIQAVALLRRPDLLLVLADAIGNEFGRQMKGLAEDLLGARVVTLGPQPFPRVPELLAAADVVVIPQRRTPATVGQLPAKLFDAMAMAKPILSTRVSDIPTVLGETGWLVEPGSPQALASALEEILADPDLAAERGVRARARCVAEFSWDAMERVLSGVFARFE